MRLTRLLPSLSAARRMGLVSMLIALGLPLVAKGQQGLSPSSFTPQEGDLTIWIIKAVFGDWQAGTRVPMLGGAFEILNLFALTFGTLMFSYVAVVGTMNTAQDGELLGRKWNSMWIPIRFTAGTALLMPLSTGYCSMQHLVLWLAMMGGGGASAVWHSVATNFASDQVSDIQATPDYQHNVEMLMRAVLKSEACVAKLNEGRDTAMFGRQRIDPDASSRKYQVGIKWGATDPAAGQRDDVCGMVEMSSLTRVSPSANVDEQFQLSTTKNNPTVDRAGECAVGLGVECYRSDGMTAAMQQVLTVYNRRKDQVEAQYQALNSAANILRPIAASLVKGESPPSAAAIKQAITDAGTIYTSMSADKTRAAVVAMTAQLQAFNEASAKMGWLMAGSSFYQMARIRTSVGEITNALPRASGGIKLDDVGASIDMVPVAMDINAMEDRVDETMKGNAGNIWDGGEQFALWLGQAMSVDPKRQTHALVQIKAVGDRVLVGTEIAAVASMTAYASVSAGKNSVFGKVANVFTGLGDTIKDVMALVMPIVYAGFMSAFMVGITMAYILPILPFTMTIGAILGWLMALFSAVTAVPIWIAGHLHPDGDEVAGKGVGGYMILLETLTRPIFIVFGLIGAFVIMDPMIKLTAILFRATVHAQEGDSTTGILSAVVLAMLYTGVIWTVVRSTMSMTYVLSETVYRWIGGQHAGMEQAREFVGNASQVGQGGAQALQQIGGYVASSANERNKARRAQRQRRDEENGGG